MQPVFPAANVVAPVHHNVFRAKLKGQAAQSARPKSAQSTGQLHHHSRPFCTLMPTPATRRAYCFNKFLFIIILPVLRKTQTRNTRPCNAILPYKSAQVLHLRVSCPYFKERRPRTSDSWQGLGQRPNVSSHCFSVDCTQFCAKDQAPAQFCVFHVLRLCYNGGSFRIFPGGFMIYGSF